MAHLQMIQFHSFRRVVTLHHVLVVFSFLTPTEFTHAALEGLPDIDTKPLLLTPFLDRKRPEEARHASQVNNLSSHLDCDQITSHSGFLTVDRKRGHHLFFWYFPSSPSSRPNSKSKSNSKSSLVIWLNGDLGDSSMVSLFRQHGPFVVNAGQRRYYHRKHSLTSRVSVVYVDNPVGVGFSFAADASTTTNNNNTTNNSTTSNFSSSNSDSAGSGDRGGGEGDRGRAVTEHIDDLVEFIHQFVTMFPEYENQEIYLGGQGFAGMYLPELALRFGAGIKRKESPVNLNLTGIILGSPIFDIPRLFKQSTKFALAMGMIRSFYGESKIRSTQSDLFWELKTKGLAAYQNQSQSQSHYQNESVYDILHRATPMDLPLSTINIAATDDVHNPGDVDVLMADEKFRKMIHVGNQSFVSRNEEVVRSFLSLVGFESLALGIAIQKFKVLVYNGNFDFFVNNIGLEACIRNIVWPGKENYNRGVWNSPWKINDEVVGYYYYYKYSKTSHNNFCRVIIQGEGHLGGRHKPEVFVTMVESFINSGCVESSHVYERY